MANFTYVARDKNGEEVTGELVGSTAETVANQLRLKDFVPIEVKLAQEKASLKDFLYNNKLNPTTMVFFLSQLRSLSKADVPLLSALKVIKDSKQGYIVTRVVDELIEGLESGKSLSLCFEHCSVKFPAIITQIIQVGEKTGNLPNALDQSIKFMEREINLTAQIKNAFRYPAIVLSVGFIAYVIINLFVAPRFIAIFEGANAELPWQTNFLISSFNFWQLYGFYIVAILALGLIYLFRSYNTPNGRWRIDYFKLKLPIIGDVYKILNQARVTSAISHMLEAGIPVNKALLVAAKISNNRVVENQLTEMKESVERGATLASAAAHTEYFKGVVLQMFSIGEKSGRIGPLLSEISNYLEETGESKIKKLTGYLEPGLILVIVGLVLLLALGVFAAMWDMAGFARLS